MNGPEIEAYLDEMVDLFSTLHDNGVIRTSALDDLSRPASGCARCCP